MSEDGDGGTRCPNCGEPLHYVPMAKAPPETLMSFSLKPKPGQKLRADTVGGTLMQLQKLMASVGKDLGVKTHTFVDSVEITEDGEIIFNLAILNGPSNAR